MVSKVTAGLTYQTCIHAGGSMAIIDGWLTTIGGYFYSCAHSNKLSLSGEGSSRRWTKKFPTHANQESEK